jgi:hypothetical protein
LNRLRELAQNLGRAKTIWMIFLLGLSIRVGITLYLGNRLLPLADQPVFLDLAEHVATGRGLAVSRDLVGISQSVSDSMRAILMTRPERVRDERLGALWGIVRPETPTAFFEPFYPLFVGGIRWIFGPNSGTHIGPEILPFGPKITIVRLFQSLFDALVIPILYFLGCALFTPVTGGVAALIYCFYPYSIAFVTNLVTQNTYLFLQAVMVFFFIRTMRCQSWGNYLALGLTAGLTLLTRISLITFIPFLVICLYLPLRRDLKWGRLAASLCIMVLAVVPWVMRNQARFGEALLLPTKGGRNLWEYNNQLFTPEKMEGHFTGMEGLYQRFAQKHFADLQAKELLPFPEFTTETEIERDRILNQRVQGFIRANPGVFVQLCGLRLYQLFRVIPTHLGGPLATLGSLITIGWILPASLIGLWLSFKGRWRERSVLYGIIFYTVGTATLTASGIPHRMPTDPYFILLAAFCVVKVLKIDYAAENP